MPGWHSGLRRLLSRPIDIFGGEGAILNERGDDNHVAAKESSVVALLAVQETPKGIGRL